MGGSEVHRRAFGCSTNGSPALNHESFRWRVNRNHAHTRKFWPLLRDRPGSRGEVVNLTRSGIQIERATDDGPDATTESSQYGQPRGGTQKACQAEIVTLCTMEQFSDEAAKGDLQNIEVLSGIRSLEPQLTEARSILLLLQEGDGLGCTGASECFDRRKRMRDAEAVQ
jgi:hypothetical protein